MTDSRAEIKIIDAVKAITYAIALTGFISVAWHIGAVYCAVFALMAVIAGYGDFKSGRHMPRWALNAAAIAVIAFSLYRLNLDDIVVPIVEGLLILLVVKLLEEKKFRDYMQIYVISMFLLAGSALLSLNMIFLLYFFALYFLAAVSIVFLSYYSQDEYLSISRQSAMKILTGALLIPLIAIPMTLMLFIILPRTQYPLWNFLNQGSGAKTGFTDNIELGGVFAIQEDSTIIMRVAMPQVNEQYLYWRGIVLDHFNGTSWSRKGYEHKKAGVLFQPSGQSIAQTIYLEGYENRYLFALDKPFKIDVKDAALSRDLTITLPKQLEHRIKYTVLSVLSDRIAEKNFSAESYLQLPAISNEIKELSKKLTDGKKDYEAAHSINNFLKNGEFRYSLDTLPVSKHPIDDFLLNRKYGNCEYFASAMAVLLRSSGIAARMVGGYKGGYYNPVGKYYMVPQKNAHVWVEAYIDGQWLRFDPTPGYGNSGKQLLKLQFLFDSINYYWNAFVINYDFKKQTSLFTKIGSGLKNFKKPNLKFLISKETIVYLFAAAITAGVVLIAYHFIFRRKSPEERALLFFLKRLEKKGYKKAKTEGLEEFTARIDSAEIRKQAVSFVTEFQRYFYKDANILPKDLKRLKDMLK
jgi:hypothetical protein